MKKYKLLILLLILGNTLFAQNISVRKLPSVVINQFNIDFPKAKDVEWELKGKTYKVEFEQRWGRDIEAWYSAKGELIKLKEELTKKELPRSILSVIAEEYPNYRLDDIERITYKNEKKYKVEIEKRNKELVLFFNNNGVLIK